MTNYRTKKFKEKLLNAFGNLKSESFDLELIESYFRKKDHSGAFQILSDKTCNDLDFQELFMFIDRTNSKIGQQFLYNRLRTIPAHSNEIIGFETLINQLTYDADFRVNIQSQLARLNDREAFYITSLFQEEHLKPPKWFFIIRLLALTSLLSLIMMFFTPVLIFVFIGVFIVNMGVHYWNKKNLYEYLASLPQLLKLSKVAKELFKIEALKEINPNLQASTDILDQVRNRMSFFNLEVKLQSDMQALFWGILEIFKIAFLIEPLILFGVLKRLENKRKEIEDVYVFVGQIDALISIASLRHGLAKYCIPEISKKQKHIIAEKAYHPLIPECVRNSITVDGKSILLTGSNMSGKTSFIRTIGINAITAMTLNTCFADRFSLPRLRVYSAIRISDDLMNDKSYYFEEVLTIKEMVDNSFSTVPNLFLLDEIFKGTNTIERISAGKAVLSALTKAGNLVFVSTHDIELADLLKDEYELYHFSEKVNQKTVDFDYKLKDGKLKNRNAIRILQINDYPESIIVEAIALSKQLDKTAEDLRNDYITEQVIIR
jgi:rRNA-processing protein FCF1